MKTDSSIGRENIFGPRLPRRRLGLNLRELLIVLGVAAVLGWVLWQMEQRRGGYNDDGKVTAAQIFVIQSVQMPFSAYKRDTGSYPTTAQGLRALMVPPPGVNGWNGPYFTTSDVPRDPWKYYYHYAYPSTHGQTGNNYDVWSNGPTGRDGASDTIGNWNSPA